MQKYDIKHPTIASDANYRNLSKGNKVYSAIETIITST